MVLEMLADEKTQIPYYKAFKFLYIEIAVWPLLYLKNEWCESSFAGTQTRLSKKRAFHLNQFQYDRYIFKSVTGAIESGKPRLFDVSYFRKLLFNSNTKIAENSLSNFVYNIKCIQDF